MNTYTPHTKIYKKNTTAIKNTINFCFILIYFVIFYYYLLEVCSFLITEREQIQIGGKEEGEMAIRIYYVIKRIYLQ